jgi:tRNA nucleotidyltransferase (CCA-adding enzyme)
MRVYCVGGAVRDELLGLPVRDRDWVVVGATPAMLEARGFRPVGRDFPVFLHPDTREEYALARTERKTGPGYRGFVVQYDAAVTLEDDLRRRDLTINALARDSEGALIDPWDGQRDLRDGVLRHVSEAFAEDPVRILRVARFAARFEAFRVAPETMALMRRMVADGEVDHLVPERVWQEFARGLMEIRPTRMIEVLRESGALARLLPELDATWNEATAATLLAAAASGAALPVRFALLLHAAAEGLDGSAPGGELEEGRENVKVGEHRDSGENGKAEDADAREAKAAARRQARAVRVDEMANRMRAPAECREIARLFASERISLARTAQLEAPGLLALIERLDGLRRTERMEQVLQASSLRDGDSGLSRLRQAAGAARAVDAGAVAKAGPRETIRERVQAARLQAIEEALRAGAPPASQSRTAGSSKSAGSTSRGRTT